MEWMINVNKTHRVARLEQTNFQPPFGLNSFLAFLLVGCERVSYGNAKSEFLHNVLVASKRRCETFRSRIALNTRIRTVWYPTNGTNRPIEKMTLGKHKRHLVPYAAHICSFLRFSFCWYRLLVTFFCPLYDSVFGLWIIHWYANRHRRKRDVFLHWQLSVFFVIQF